MDIDLLRQGKAGLLNEYDKVDIQYGSSKMDHSNGANSATIVEDHS